MIIMKTKIKHKRLIFVYTVQYLSFVYAISHISFVRKVCNVIGNTVIDQAFAGYNTTLFTYGARNSGKTTVLYGKRNESGIISFVLNNLFAAADKSDAETSFRCEIR